MRNDIIYTKNDQIGLKDRVWHTLSAGTIKPDTRIIRKYYMFSSSIPLLVIAFALVMKCGRVENLLRTECSLSSVAFSLLYFQKVRLDEKDLFS